MKVYIDSENKCHAVNAPGLTEVETEFFDVKCKTFIEGYKLVPQEAGEYVFPFKSFEVLEAAQKEYEQLQSEIEDMQAALELLGVTV